MNIVRKVSTHGLETGDRSTDYQMSSIALPGSAFNSYLVNDDT